MALQQPGAGELSAGGFRAELCQAHTLLLRTSLVVFVTLGMLRAGTNQGGLHSCTQFISHPSTAAGEERRVVIDADDGIRPGTTPASLGQLRPVFKKGGSTTAGNSSQVGLGGWAGDCARGGFAGNPTRRAAAHLPATAARSVGGKPYSTTQQKNGPFGRPMLV